MKFEGIHGVSSEDAAQVQELANEMAFYLDSRTPIPAAVAVMAVLELAVRVLKGSAGQSTLEALDTLAGALQEIRQAETLNAVGPS